MKIYWLPVFSCQSKKTNPVSKWKKKNEEEKNKGIFSTEFRYMKSRFNISLWFNSGLIVGWGLFWYIQHPIDPISQ